MRVFSERLGLYRKWLSHYMKYGVLSALGGGGKHLAKKLYAKRKLQSLWNKPERLFNDKSICLDLEFANKWLRRIPFYRYKIVRMKIGDVRRKWVDGKIYKLDEVAPYQYLTNQEQGKQIYQEYCAVHDGTVCSARFDALIASVEKNGFDETFMPVVNQENIILDGQHRSCILLHKYGPDYKIKVLKLWYC